jgi:hypothetical protein
MASNYNYDIAISYEFESQKTCVQIKTSLEKLGYKVWMDDDKTKSDAIENIIEGIDNSDFMIICISQKYEDSESCKMVSFERRSGGLFD